ncbi:hypothetical protein L5515_013555 [Caenorhabditis briggsae]|uniref:Uncharacterized protein n=1 Tax=Caenorhabditis briggsae TaxID=6238 RepID=A0AAE9E6N8_CAEBR|nr:hypothetical protein L5515_013555 [Caenorhabditis briggsae]
MKFTLLSLVESVVFLALAMMACLSNAWTNFKGPCKINADCSQAKCLMGFCQQMPFRKCDTTADCQKDHQCNSGFCYDAPKNIDTLFDQGDN